MLNLPFPIFLYGIYDYDMKALVHRLQRHKENNVGRRKPLHQRPGRPCSQFLQHALNEIEPLFPNEVLIYQ
jgi:hypothetical protein